MGVRKDLSQLAPLEVVEMFVFDSTSIGSADIIRWHPGTTVAGDPIQWQGAVYQPFPVAAEGFEISSVDKLPRPTLKASNIGGLLGAYLRSKDDAVGARITRKRTLGKYLDAVNFPGGNPNADPNAHFPDEVWYIARKVNENPVYIEVELAVAFDVEGVLLPRRQVIASTCQWVYRDPETCTYAGGAILNDPTYPGVDKCGKSLYSCRLRFGGGILPTSAFPSSLLTRMT
jgi:lambda family phage minor tail protein L